MCVRGVLCGEVCWTACSSVWRGMLDCLQYDLWCVCMQCTHTPQVQNMPPNTDRAHNKHIWTIICNFNQVETITPWWWILCDPKHVGVIFNVCLLDFYSTQILTSTTVSIECISWLIKVLIIMMHGGNLKLFVRSVRLSREKRLLASSCPSVRRCTPTRLPQDRFW